jgi:hypothetical protein
MPALDAIDYGSQHYNDHPKGDQGVRTQKAICAGVVHAASVTGPALAFSAAGHFVGSQVGTGVGAIVPGLDATLIPEGPGELVGGFLGSVGGGILGAHIGEGWADQYTPEVVDRVFGS